MPQRINLPSQSVLGHTMTRHSGLIHGVTVIFTVENIH